MRIRIVMKYQKDIKRLRIVRISFAKEKKRVSFSVEPKWFATEKEPGDFEATVLGVRVHYKHAGGGRFVD